MDSHYSTETSVQFGGLNQDDASPRAPRRRRPGVKPALPRTGQERTRTQRVPADQGKMRTSASRFLSNHLHHPVSLRSRLRGQLRDQNHTRGQKMPRPSTICGLTRRDKEGNGGRDAHGRVFSYLFRVTKSVGGITRT